MIGYDVILCMDWLLVYRELIDCHHHMIIFYLPYGFKIVLLGESVLISNVHYLIHVINID